MISTAFRYKSAAAVVFMALGIAMFSRAAQTDKTPASGTGEIHSRHQESRLNGCQNQEPGRSDRVAGRYGRRSAGLRANHEGVTAENCRSRGDCTGKCAPLRLTQPDWPRLTSSPKQTPTLPDPSFSRGVPDDYVIGAGDTLQISVWKEPEASVPVVVVRPDGKITVPLIKEVEVAGLTPTQAEQTITERLTKFIADANVTVVVATISSKKIYIIGAARKEGPLPYTYGMSVMQALSEAGGITEYAKRKKIYILRTENGREYRLDFNYDDVVKGQSMEQNILLLPGDTVVIPH